MNTKRKISILISIAVAGMMVMACGLLSLPGSPKAAPTSFPGADAASSLWPDVPSFPGATPDTTTNLFFSQIPSDAMKNLVFYTDKQPADVAAFYTDDLMKTQGWQPQSADVVKFLTLEQGGQPQTKTGSISGCYADVYNGQPRAVCIFTKTDDQGQDIELTITAKPDTKSNQTMLTYTRATGSSGVIPTP